VSRKVILSAEAAEELDALTEFIAADSLDAALHFLDAAQNAFERLLSMPELGAARELKRRRVVLRMWPIPDFPNHLIFYRPTTDVGIEIVRVLHAARDIPRILEE